jgi:hypothetical protein
MDARHAPDAQTALATAPTIARSTNTPWVGAEPNHSLNTVLAVSWMGFLWSIGFFAGPSSDTIIAPLSFVDNLAKAMFLVTLGGIVAVIGFAIKNSPLTPIVSAAAGLSMVLIGATCGFAGHPISAWGPNAGSAALIALGSVALMGRRATS